MATGANTDVFDHDTIEAMAGGRVRAIAANYKPWIEERRERFSSPFLYEQIELLAADFEVRFARRMQARQEESAQALSEADTVM